MAYLLGPAQESSAWGERDRLLRSERMLRAWTGNSNIRLSDDPDEPLPLIHGVEPEPISTREWNRLVGVVGGADRMAATGPAAGVTTVALTSAGFDPTIHGHAYDQAMVAIAQAQGQDGATLDSNSEAWYEKGDNVAKGAVRWLMLGGDALVDTLFDRLPRAAAMAESGQMSPLDAAQGLLNPWSGQADKIGNPAFFEALGVVGANILPGEQGAEGRLSLGSGWIPNSELAPQTMQRMGEYQAYIDSLESGDPAPQIGDNLYVAGGSSVEDAKFLADTMGRRYDFNQFTMQEEAFYAERGQPLTHTSQLNREAVVLPVTNPLYGESWTQVSLGRVLAMPFTEPGTSPNHWISGTIDFNKQVFGDLGVPAGEVIAGARNATRSVRATEAAADLGLGARLADDVSEEIIQTAGRAQPKIDSARNLINSGATRSLEPTKALKTQLTNDFGDEIATELLRALSQDLRKGQRLITDEYLKPVKELEAIPTRQSLVDMVANEQKIADELPELLEGMRNWDLDSTKRVKALVEETFDNPEDKMRAWDEFLEVSRREDAADILLDQRARRTVDPNKVETFMTGPQARPFVEALRDAKTMDEIDEILSATSRRGGFVDPKVRSQLAKAETNAEVLDILLPQVNLAGLRTGMYATTKMGMGSRAGLAAATLPAGAGGLAAGFGELQLAAEDGLSIGDVPRIAGAAVGGAVLGAAVGAGSLTAAARLTGKAGDIKAASLTDAYLAGMREAVQAALGDSLPGTLANTGIRTQMRYAGGTNGLGRRIAQMAPQSVDLNSSARAYAGARDFMRNVGITGRNRFVRLTRKMENGRSETMTLRTDRAEDLTEQIGGLKSQGWEVTKDIDMDDVLHRLANTEGGNYEAYFRQFSELMDVAYDSLIEGGMGAEAAEALTRFTYDLGDDALNFVNAVGDNVTYPASGLKTIIGGEEVVMPGPQLLTELFNGQMMMADPRVLKRAINDSDAWGRTMNKIATKGEDAMFQQRALVRLADGFMQRAWKPLVLLRLAFPIRIVGIDEQGRMAASGLDSMWRHPISYFSYLLGRNGRTFRAFRMEGDNLMMSTDIRGALSHGDVRKIDWENIDDLNRIEVAEDARDALGMHTMFNGESGTYGANMWTRIRRGSKNYHKSVAGELRQLWRDPITQRLFKFQQGGAVDGIDDAVDWLMTGAGRPHYDRLLQSMDQQTRVVWRQRDAVRMYVEGINARAHLKAGGDFTFIDEMGRQWDSGGRLISESADASLRRNSYHISRAGNDEILASYATGEFRGLKVSNRMDDDAFKAITAEVRKLDDELIKAGQPTFPEFVKGSRSGVRDTEKGIGAAYDSALNKLFDLAMGIPTRRLSRSPAFGQLYYQRMGGMLADMDEATFAKAVAMAEADGMAHMLYRGASGERMASESLVKFAPRRAEEAARAKNVSRSGSDIITDFDQVDSAAKAFALTETQDLLFDLSKKMNMADSLRVMFPFVEAFREVFVSWGRVFAENPYKLTRRAGQLIEGAREAEVEHEAGLLGYKWDRFGDWRSGSGPEAVPGDQQGFIYSNAYGQEVFNYPLYGTALQMLSGQQAEFSGSVGGMNMVFGGGDLDNPDMPEVLGFPVALGIPGVGTVVQAPLAVAFNDDPKWDPYKAVIFPFGEPDNFGNLVGLAPWAQRLMKSTPMLDGVSRWFMGPESERLYNNVLMESRLSLQVEGIAGYGPQYQIDMSTESGMIEFEGAAGDRARSTYLVRGFAQFAGPSGPSAPTFLAELPEDAPTDFAVEQWGVRVLADEWWSIYAPQDADGNPIGEGHPDYADYLRRYGIQMPNGDWQSPIGDQSLSTLVFQQLHNTGIEPAVLTVSRSSKEGKTFYTREGSIWQRENPELWERLPQSAWYLAPDPEALEAGPFDYGAYIDGVRSGRIVPKDPDQYVGEQKAILGEMAWDEARAKAEGLYGSKSSPEKDRWLAEQRERIGRRYPGWKIEGSTGYVADWEVTLNEMNTKWRDPAFWQRVDPNGHQVHTVNAVTSYLDYRNELLLVQAEIGAGTTLAARGREGSPEYAASEALRRELDAYASMIINAEERGDAPGSNFGLIYEQVLSKELDPRNQPEPWEDDFDIQDIYHIQYNEFLQEAG